MLKENRNFVHLTSFAHH